MSATPVVPEGALTNAGGLRRSVGFWGLTFVSLGSIIGSGWLLSALQATQVAGPAAILSWLLAAVMLAILALVYAELGAAYPVTGGTGRFPFFSHGSLAGFVAAWSSWLQAVATAPIEVLGAITYVNSVGWVGRHFPMIDTAGSNQGLLNGRGLVVAALGMVLFTAVNLAGAKFMSESNTWLVIWKTAVPLLAIVVVTSASFHPGNFDAGGGFMPHGIHGVFAALPLGVVFALQGFEQAAQLAGEARNPQRDLSRAILTAMAVGAAVYILLQAAFIVAVEPADIADGWSHPLGLGGADADYGAWYTLALAVGAGWLAAILITDSVVSPTGTGIVYVGTTARLTYALGEQPELPSVLTRTNRRGVPVWAILVSAGLGLLCLGPFPSWSKLVQVVTGATAIMYAFAPVALGALHRRDVDRPRAYRMPVPRVLLPLGFVSANLVLYWGGYDNIWKIDCAIAAGLLLFGVGAVVKRTLTWRMLRHGYWVVPWLGGATIIGRYGNYGGAHPVFDSWFAGEWSDLVVVSVFSVVVYQWAIAIAQPTALVQAAVADDQPPVPAAELSQA